MYYNNGDRYEGDWNNNKKEGKGVYFHRNGDREMGNYLDGKAIGKYAILRANGDVISKIY